MSALDNFKNVYFENCRLGKLAELEKEVEKEKILKAYDEILCAANRKTNIVKGLYELYSKLMKKLDGELEKFRLELEADNSGITQQIEQSMLSLPTKFHSIVL
ncbi:Inhibitor of growth protein 3 [Cichlidogyrus casuarinus]|uniref:Inhibitor of growth protein 3 n=1 Tax=Cichlidogyrus casuarinus TaxID=1844966 RepID=A0ABD2Q794_9PLAT